MTQSINAELYPGSMGLAGLCVDCVGASHVDAGSWTTPVTLIEVNESDIETIVELAGEQGVDIQVKRFSTNN